MQSQTGAVGEHLHLPVWLSADPRWGHVGYRIVFRLRDNQTPPAPE